MVTPNVTDRRSLPRQFVEGSLQLIVEGAEVACELNDISISVISVITETPPKVGELVIIDVPGIGVLQACVTRVSGHRVALTLDHAAQVKSGGVEELARALS